MFAGQQAIIPIVFRSPQRADEWFLFDENGQHHFIPANPTKMLLRVYGGAAPGAAVVFINTDAGWNAMPSIETVSTDFTLNRTEVPTTTTMQEVPPYDFFAPELARIFRQQIRVMDRATVNFICASTKTALPGDSWVSLKPLRPILYPNVPQFHKLPPADATLLVAFYDSLQGIADTLDGYIDQWPTTDVNAWNGLMHQARTSLELGERAVKVFCPDKPFNDAGPASGTMLDQYQRAMAGAEKAFNAHLARHGISSKPVVRRG
jgi:hypothetical protein